MVPNPRLWTAWPRQWPVFWPSLAGPHKLEPVSIGRKHTKWFSLGGDCSGSSTHASEKKLEPEGWKPTLHGSQRTSAPTKACAIQASAYTTNSHCTVLWSGTGWGGIGGRSWMEDIKKLADVVFPKRYYSVLRCKYVRICVFCKTKSECSNKMLRMGLQMLHEVAVLEVLQAEVAFS